MFSNLLRFLMVILMAGVILAEPDVDVDADADAAYRTWSSKSTILSDYLSENLGESIKK